MIGGLQGENRDLNNKYLKKKNLKESVVNIWEHTGGFCSLQHELQKFHKLKVSISQEKVDFTTWILWFRSLRNCLSAWCGYLPMVITSSFQLWFVPRLKHWISEFPSFETTYSMHKMDSRKCIKIVVLLDFFILDSSLYFSSLHSWFAFGKGLQGSKAWILHVNELPFSLPWIIQNSPSS